jgi:dihydrofolate reductase
MVVGGENLYRQTLPLASRMYLTLIHAQIEGDACFPKFDLGDWHETSRESHARDARHAHAYSFVTLERC